MSERTDPHASRRKTRDRAIALLLAGILLLLPPVAGVSLIEAKPGGLPFPLLYVFAVWAALIAGALMLAGPLLASDADPARNSDPDGAG